MPVIKEKKVKEIKVPETRKSKKSESQKSVKPVLVFVIVILSIVILVGAGFIFYPKIFKQAENEQVLNIETWQAVFLSSGQVYFGHVLNRDVQFITLTDVYYLKLNEDETPADQLETNEENTNKQNISLIQLGNELHGPEDEMMINRDHILFIEDLKSSSPVAKAINDLYQTK